MSICTIKRDQEITINATIINPQAKTVIKRQIGAVDGQIDQCVYKLYNLTNEEIKVVKGETK
jgi:hypothetical protein